MSFAVALLAAAAATCGWSFYEATRLDARERALPDPRWPDAWFGARLVHLTDLHIRRWGSFERRVAAEVRAARPDLILLTGDFLEAAEEKAALAEFLAAAVSGVPAYGVRGDNDTGSRAVSLEVARAHGVTLLQNRAVPVERAGRRLWLAGVDDPHEGRPDLAAALADVPEGEPVVLLAHAPEIALDLEHLSPKNVVLTLCGHTHGGQICLPWYGAIYTHARTGLRFRSGPYAVAGGTLYVGRGLGTSRIEARFCCPPELTTFVLQPG